MQQKEKSTKTRISKLQHENVLWSCVEITHNEMHHKNRGKRTEHTPESCEYGNRQDMEVTKPLDWGFSRSHQLSKVDYPSTHNKCNWPKSSMK